MAVVPNWQPAGKLMHFPRLTSSGSAVPVYTIGWRIIDHPDRWTDRFLGFKSGRVPHVQGATRVLRAAVAELCTVLRLNCARTGIAAALSSHEERLNPNSPLAVVGKSVAENLGMKWLPDAFEKAVHRPLHSLTAGAERDDEVGGKYRCKRLSGVDTIVLLDDFVTRGATFGEMARACLERNPGIRVVGLALGKNERADFAQQFGVTVNNDHVPHTWDTLWTAMG